MKDNTIPISFDRIAELVGHNEDAPPENNAAFELEHRSVLIERVLTDVAFRLLHETRCPAAAAELAPWTSSEGYPNRSLFRGGWNPVLEHTDAATSYLQRALQARANGVARTSAGPHRDGSTGNISDDRHAGAKRARADGDRCDADE